MSNTIEDVRQLVKVVDVDAIEEIPGALHVEVAVVGGWRVVVKKGEFEDGDCGMFFEIDSCLPVDDERFAFLAERSVREYEGKRYHRLRTVKLRGVVSQGLLLPIALFCDLYSSGGVPLWVDEEDWTTNLGVLKWDDIAPQTANLGSGQAAGSFPSHLGKKTDSERVQNLTNVWSEIQKHYWFATEKVDGTSLSVFRKDGELIVCSRNWAIKDGDNTYWDAVRQYPDLFNNLEEGHGIQGEIYGNGIQGNPLGVAGTHLAVFAYLVYGVPQGREDWPDNVYDHAVPEYPLELPETVAEAVVQADGIKSLIGKDRLAEGIVWHEVNGESLRCLGDRPNFKSINNRYLLKKK